MIVQFSDFVKGFTERSTGKKVWNFSKNGHPQSKIGKLVGGSRKQDLLRGSATRCHLWPKLRANVAVVSSRVAMSTGQEAVTPQKPPGGGIVAPSPAALSPVSERGFLTTIKSLSREATRVWAIPVSDHCKGEKEVLIDVVLWGARVSLHASSAKTPKYRYTHLQRKLLSEIAGLFRMAPRGLVQTLTPRT